MVEVLHGTDTADWLSKRYPAVMQWVANGWTIDSALDHMDGACDIAICTHPDHEGAQR